MQNQTAAVIELQPDKPVPTAETRVKPGPRPGPKPKRLEDRVRYFLAKSSSVGATPELGEEVSSEKEALIKAFRSEHGLFYTIAAFHAEIDDGGDNPVIVKRATTTK